MASVETISNVFTATIRNLTQMIESKVSKTVKINGHFLASETITLHASDIDGLQHVTNTSDMDKPVSLLQQAALAELAPLTTTVNGHALSEHTVVISSSDIPGVDQVDNTRDVDKPVSSATQAALALKVDTSTTINTHALTGDITLTPADFNLENVTNTSDADKPISTAQQLALDSINTMLQTMNASISTLTSLLSNAVPVGAVVMLFTNTVPVNYLICDGSVLAQADYPELYAVLGTLYCDNSVDTQVDFQLPDLRGEFVRGLDRGRGVDINRTLSLLPQAYSTALPSTLQFTTDSQGAHVHSMSSTGAHTHTTDSQGDHVHDYYRSYIGNSNNLYHPNRTDRIATGEDNRTLTTGSETFTTAGAHTHTTDSQGAHTHAIVSAGAHAHSIVGGGDPETRPVNHACNFAMKARTL